MSPAAPAGLGHIPVLLNEAMEALEPRADGLYVDGTFGGGGYTRALLDRGARVIALDRDPSAIRAGAELAASSGGRLELVEARFGELDEVARRLGVELGGRHRARHRGFVHAVRRGGARLLAPLRRAPRHAHGKNRPFGRRHPARRRRGDDRRHSVLFRRGARGAPIARAIVADREAKPFTSTLELAGLIARVAPARHGELTHPATRAFQALRIAVNDELHELVRGLCAAELLLRPGGRLVVVTFHSLEDRIVKQFFAGRSGRGRAASRLLPGEPAEAEPTFEAPRGQPIEPSEAEARANPRSRSAKLRFAVRLGAPPRGRDEGIESLARLPARRGR